MMDKDQLKHIMQKYLDGTATVREKKMIEAWILLGEKEEVRIPDRGKAILKNRIWMQIRPESMAVPETQGLIQANLNAGKPGSGSEPARLFSLPGSNKPLFLRLSARGLRYAAIWLALICLSSAVWLYRDNILDRINPIAEQSRRTGPYETIQFLLPDSSLVTLAENSSILYPVRYRGGRRWARLNGRAFFDVRKNPLASFTLQSRGMNVIVLGTSFEVNNMDSGDKALVTVVSGKVQVADADQPIALLARNQRVSFNKLNRKTLVERNIDATVLTNWTLNRMVFNETPLATVLKAIAAGYGINIVPGKNVLQTGATFSGHFTRTESWKDLLDVVCISSGLSWSITGDHVVITRN